MVIIENREKLVHDSTHPPPQPKVGKSGNAGLVKFLGRKSNVQYQRAGKGV